MSKKTTNTMDWDLTSYFPEFNGPEMIQFKQQLKDDIKSIKERAGKLSPLDNDKFSLILKI